MHSDIYNPAQQEAINLLGTQGKQRLSFDPNLRNELRSRLETAIKPLLEASTPDQLGDDAIYLNKFVLSQVMGCEQKFLADRAEPFQWSPPKARGTIVHKAIELLINWRKEPVPLDLVDEAVAGLENSDKSIADYLTTCGEAERAELRAEAGTMVTQFMECFPALKPKWRPTTDSPIRVELLDGKVVLSGKPDLTLGQPDNNVAGKVIIDFKTGKFSPTHREDLRFYALLEAVRILPPRLVATYYLDQAQIHPEEVSHELLLSSVQRVIDGAERYIELIHHKRPATLTTGPTCNWCPILHNCEEGSRYLEDSRDSPEF